MTDADGDDVVRVNFPSTPAGNTTLQVIYGNFTLHLDLGVPNTMQALFDLVGAVTETLDLDNSNLMPAQEKARIDAILADADLSRIDIFADGEDVFALEFRAFQSGIAVGDLTFEVTGNTLPLSTLLDLAGILRDDSFEDAVEAITKTGVSKVTFTGPDAVLLAEARIDEGEDVAAFLDTNIIIGDEGDDSVMGTVGNDYINPGGNTFDDANGFFGFDAIDGSAGNDTIEYGNNGPDGFQSLSYQRRPTAITVDLDTADNSLAITKGCSGMDVVNSINTPVLAGGPSINGGFAVHGSSSGDTFNINQTVNGWIRVRGNGGDDTLNLGLGAEILRIDYANAFEGTNINLATGIVGRGGTGG